jgi:hypothetical protein
MSALERQSQQLLEKFTSTVDPTATQVVRAIAKESDFEALQRIL